jgi:hypothetical protein
MRKVRGYQRYRVITYGIDEAQGTSPQISKQSRPPKRMKRKT